jgi:hypothetical protein
VQFGGAVVAHDVRDAAPVLEVVGQDAPSVLVTVDADAVHAEPSSLRPLVSGERHGVEHLQVPAAVLGLGHTCSLHHVV